MRGKHTREILKDFVPFIKLGMSMGLLDEMGTAQIHSCPHWPKLCLSPSYRSSCCVGRTGHELKSQADGQRIVGPL